MLKLGEQNIKGLYLGEQEIKKAYLGENLVANFEESPYTVGVDWWEGSMPSAQLWYGIDCGDGHFSASPGSTAKTFAYSDDGVNWASFIISASGMWRGMAYGNGVFVSPTYNTSPGIVAISKDFGRTWSTVRAAISGGSFSNVVFGGTYFLAFGTNYVGVMYSENGENWYTGKSFPAKYNINRMVSHNGMFVAPVYNDTKVFYNNDPKNNPWSISTLSEKGNWFDGAYGNGKFVFLAYNSNKAIISEDGMNWEIITLPVTGNWQAVAFGGGKFVAVEYNGTKVLHSSDGINWEISNLPSASTWFCGTGNNDMVVFLANNSNKLVYSSKKGPIS